MFKSHGKWPNYRLNLISRNLKVLVWWWVSRFTKFGKFQFKFSVLVYIPQTLLVVPKSPTQSLNKIAFLLKELVIIYISWWLALYTNHWLLRFTTTTATTANLKSPLFGTRCVFIIRIQEYSKFQPSNALSLPTYMDCKMRFDYTTYHNGDKEKTRENVEEEKSNYMILLLLLDSDWFVLTPNKLLIRPVFQIWLLFFFEKKNLAVIWLN